MKNQIKFNNDFLYDKVRGCFIVPEDDNEIQEEEKDIIQEKIENPKEELKENIPEKNLQEEKNENPKEEVKEKTEAERKENLQKKQTKKNQRITFEELYKSKNHKIIKSGVEYILYKNYYYPFINPYNIKFIFPDGEEKEIFIPRNKCIFDIIDSYQNYKYLVKLKGKNEFEEKEITINDKYSEIKFLPFLINSNDYKKIYTIIDLESNQESLSSLSPVFDLYFDNKIISNSEPTFKYTNERVEFFKFLEKEIEQKELIPLCGPEGIGKTISILAFFKEKNINYNYFYCNLKKLFNLFKEQNMQLIKQIMIYELFHCCKLKLLNENLQTLEKIFKNPIHPIEIINEILAQLNLRNIVIILDQYKIKYDQNYFRLQQLINSNISFKRQIKLVIISSMNELDVKESIVENLRFGEKKTGFSLHYIYISSLVSCDENDKNKLNEEERNLLTQYGNNYQIFYEIITKREEYKNKALQINISDNFTKYFEDNMKINFENRLNDYFNNENSDKNLETKLYYLMNCSNENIPIKKFIDNSSNIPFRFFVFNYKNEKIFKISDIKQTDTISLNFQCDKYLYFIGYLYEKLKKGENLFNKTISGLYKAITLEESFSHYLWCDKNGFLDKHKNIKITEKINIKNFFDINKDEFKLGSLNDNEAILFIPSDQNAKLFDCGVLVCINKSLNAFHLYLFQVTKIKNNEKRMSYLTLNDNLNYLKLYYMQSLKINIDKQFFAYIFDEKKKDKASINFCIDNNIDYIIFNEDEFKIKEKSDLSQYKAKIKILDYNGKKNKHTDDLQIFMEIEKNSNGKLEDSLTYLKKKRKIMKKIKYIDESEIENKILDNKKIFEIKKIEKNKPENNNNSNDIVGKINKEENTKKQINIEIEDIKNIYKNFKQVKDYFSSFKKNKVEEIDDIKKEKIIQDYLLGKSKKNLPGISYSTENQKNYISILLKYFKPEEIKKLFKHIFDNDNKFIIQVYKLKETYIEPYLIPEYNTYIIVKFKEDIYYIDYINQIYLSLKDDNNKSFDYMFKEAEFLAISFVTLDKKNEYISNYMNS